MRACRLHITGASGTGTTTLGRAVASAWSVPHADVDDYFWVPTHRPYVVKRDVLDRLRLMDEVFLPRDSWVLSGSAMGWGDPLIGLFDAVVFLALDPITRLQRLKTREALRYGRAVASDGPGEDAPRAFMSWARGYDAPDFPGRSRARHDRWLSTLPCPVLHLDSTEPVPRLQAALDEWTPDSPETGR